MTTDNEAMQRLVNSASELRNADTNMAIWNAVRDTENKYLNPPNKFKGYTSTTIKSHSRIQAATKLWGIMGGQWGIRNEIWDFTSIPQAVFYRADLYFPGGSIPIKATVSIMMGSRFDDDAVKKVVTDALGKGMSYLGFNADVYLGEREGYEGAAYEDDKYHDAAHRDTPKQPLPAKLPAKTLPAKQTPPAVEADDKDF